MEHECKYLKGKIRDVVVRSSDKSIRCRRCGKKLEEEEIDPKTWRKIKNKKRRR